DLRVGDADPGGAGIQRAAARSQGSVAAVPGQDDRSKPGAGDTADRAVPREWLGKGRVYGRPLFVRRYTAADIQLLAGVDEAHETLSGPATQKILYREFHDYGDQRYQRLSSISVPHIYNLRKSRVYLERKICYQKTKPVQVNIGERRRPDPQGRPGYLRIDTVHQGDLDG